MSPADKFTEEKINLISGVYYSLSARYFVDIRFIIFTLLTTHIYLIF